LVLDHFHVHQIDAGLSCQAVSISRHVEGIIRVVKEGSEAAGCKDCGFRWISNQLTGANVHPFNADTSWKVFEEGLPENFRSNFPKSEWVGPFRLTVPKLGGKTIIVFGKRLDFERSQNEFLAKFKGGTKRL